MTKPVPIEVVLLKPHTHAGEMLQPDTTIKVNPTLAQWLISNDIAKAVDAKTSKEAK